MIKENFGKMIERSIKKNWDLPGLSNFKGKSLSYGQIADRIIYLHQVFKKFKIKPGDKVALLGKNSANWGIAYLSTVTYGAVVVPILTDFHANDIHHIVNHSDSKILFVMDNIFTELDPAKMDKVNTIFSIENYEILFTRINKAKSKLLEVEKSYLEAYGGVLTSDKLSFDDISNETLEGIVYTSGTTGFSKGVMLTHNNLAANMVFAREHMDLVPGDTILSFLPVAHSFGCAFEFLYPFCMGCHITFLGRIPSPTIILKAFNKIKPNLILSVPLVLEKIYNSKIKKATGKFPISILIKTPILKKLIYKKIRKTLVDSFGGEFNEFVIGGAPLNAAVEDFLKKIRFPFTIGYGMTECAPLISYINWREHRKQSVGICVNTLDCKVDSDDPQTEVGELLVKGENVMIGYYKEKEKTAEAIDEEGWLHTGDLALIDEDGFIYIKGRKKTMLLGPSGQNIYPEVIEAKLSNLPFIEEAILVKREGKLVALVYPDYDNLKLKGAEEKRLNKIMRDNREKINEVLPAFSKISKIQIYPEEFEKTPKKSIKRYMYK